MSLYTVPQIVAFHYTISTTARYSAQTVSTHLDEGGLGSGYVKHWYPKITHSHQLCILVGLILVLASRAVRTRWRPQTLSSAH